mmetsp:Transcript_30012/g.76967  ORF Transcript_30012/g.76967 Transcript_30012/m.76967 type:complete len:720 (-) Transcript_30012:152-2311(-)
MRGLVLDRLAVRASPSRAAGRRHPRRQQVRRARGGGPIDRSGCPFDVCASSSDAATEPFSSPHQPVNPPSRPVGPACAPNLSHTGTAHRHRVHPSAFNITSARCAHGVSCQQPQAGGHPPRRRAQPRTGASQAAQAATSAPATTSPPAHDPQPQPDSSAPSTSSSCCCSSARGPASASLEGVSGGTQLLSEGELASIYGYRRDLGKNYHMLEVIGKGGFGTVRRAIDYATGRSCAVKCIPKRPHHGEATYEYLLRLRSEVEAMSQLGASLDAVNLQEVYEDDGSIYLVMELCTGGRIMDRYAEQPCNAACSERSAAGHMHSVFRFLAQCHANGVIYRDVKPENFLFLDDTVDSPLKAADFGMAVRFQEGDCRLQDRTGTPAYMAPEVIDTKTKYNEKCDMWSAGIMMYELLTGRLPWGDDLGARSNNQVMMTVLSCDSCDITSSFEVTTRLSEEAQDLLRRLICQDPAQRVSATEALEHPWIKKFETQSELVLHGTLMQRIQRFASCCTLKQHVLVLVTRDLMDKGLHPSSDLQHLFHTINTRGQAAGIQLDDMLAAVLKFGYHVTRDELSQLMARLDLHSEGALDFWGFSAALMDWENVDPAVVQAAVADVYEHLDTRRVGYLEPQDLVGLVSAARSDAGQRFEVNRIMREIDRDGVLYAPAFMQICTSSLGMQSLIRYDSRLPASAEEECRVPEGHCPAESFEENIDGYIDPDELFF